MYPGVYVLLAVVSFAATVSLNYRARVKEEVVLIVGETCYHLHHWMTAVGAAVLLLVGASMTAVARKVAVAIILGIAAEGAMFSDWWRVREHCERAFTISPLAFSEGGMQSAKPV